MVVQYMEVKMDRCIEKKVCGSLQLLVDALSNGRWLVELWRFFDGERQSFAIDGVGVGRRLSGSTCDRGTRRFGDAAWWYC